jgi:hypothetical protein
MKTICLLGMMLLGLTTVTARAGDPQAPTFSIVEENDLLWKPFGDHTDRHYTQGLKLVYMGGATVFTNVASRLDRLMSGVGMNDGRPAFGFAVGQNIYTPEDYSVDVPDPDDRPYAGWLYGELIFQRSSAPTGLPALETFTVSLGVVGPEALGEQAQNTMHEIREFPLANGWDAQLETEPALLLKYDRRWRLTPSHQLRSVFDMVPHVSGNLGNVTISAETGLMLRAGWNLPADFGAVRIDSAASPVSNGTCWSAYAHAGATGRVVGHNLFLDGNTFRDGPSVDREPWVADVIWGVAIQCGRHVSFHWTWIYRTEEFTTQRGPDKFGSASLKLTFPL